MATQQNGDGRTRIGIEPTEADQEEAAVPPECATSLPDRVHQALEGVERSHQRGSSESTPSASGEFGESGEFLGVVGGFDLSLCEVSNGREKLPQLPKLPRVTRHRIAWC